MFSDIAKTNHTTRRVIMSFQYKDLNISELSIKVGAKKPFRFLHVTDSHLARFDPEKPCTRFEKTRELIDTYFAQSCEYCRENNIPMVNTGDVYDFISEANFEYMTEQLQGVDHIYATGNHDFCHWVGDATENQQYKWRNIKKVAKHFNCNMHFDSRVINGVNFVTIDDGYYLFTEGQLEMLKAEVARELPIILCMHVPIYMPGLAKFALDKGQPTSIVATPLEIIEKYREPYRRFQQEADDTTLKVVNYIKNEPLIKVLFAGHTHTPNHHDEELCPGKMQYVGAGGYNGYARLVTVE